MEEHLENWRCPECGQVSYYWHFTERGVGLIATLPATPNMSGMEEAKRKAIEEAERSGLFALLET